MSLNTIHTSKVGKCFTNIYTVRYLFSHCVSIGIYPEILSKSTEQLLSEYPEMKRLPVAKVLKIPVSRPKYINSLEKKKD